MTCLRLSVVLCGILTGGAAASPLFDDAARAALGAEIRSVLRDAPEIVDRALNPPTAFEQAVDADMAQLSAFGPQLFDQRAEGFGPSDAPLRLAVFIAADCGFCAQALEELRALQMQHDLRVTLHRMDDGAEGSALAQALDLREAPSYVLPDMMIQGHMPPVVLARYLAR